MKLNDIRDNPGSKKDRIRVGRGIGSGKGKTGGRGVKGQKSRTGVRIKGFEGGQMPIHRRLPKRGFTNIFATHLNEVNLGRVQTAIDKGKLDAGKPVTAEALVAAGVLNGALDGVRLLGNGELKAKVAFEVHGASKSAAAAVEKLGGSIKRLAPPKPERESKEVKEAKKALKPKEESKPKEAKEAAAVKPAGGEAQS
jgi:large subunit ribosomal protein L15